ncbi:hypothetical protein LP416_01880 [Polaromonas sp. P2-4]|nr:hypothetical protein LP416_01880 [Polaromonas sp. P2-4]
MRRTNEKEKGRGTFPTEATAIAAADSSAFQHRRGENWEHAKPAGLQPQGLTGTSAQARMALPLSQAAQAVLAQRTLASRDESQVVHVTIGRIDVVANTAPAPAPRRSPTPRQGTVTLADYLRGSHGGRQ